MRSLACAAMVALALPAASAAEPQLLEPALHVHWAFGGKAAPLPRWRLGLYPNDVAWRRTWAEAGLLEAATRVPRPAVVSLDLGGGEPAGLQLIGLPVSAAEEEKQSIGWPLYVGGAVLALGAVIAWAADKTGEALAEGLTPRPGDADDDDDTDGGILCIDGQCVLPCGTTGPINSCNGG